MCECEETGESPCEDCCEHTELDHGFCIDCGKDTGSLWVDRMYEDDYV